MVESNIIGVKDFERFEVLATYKTALTHNSGETGSNIVIEHGLNFVPIVIVYMTFPDDADEFKNPLPLIFFDLTGGSIDQYYWFGVTESYIQVEVDTPESSSSFSSDFTVTFVIYVLGQTSR